MFAAAGTAGQRCTSLRRLIVHTSIADNLVPRIVEAYRTLNIGSPTPEGTLVGPLINAGSFKAQQEALAQAVDEGGEVIYGGNRVLAEEHPEAFYVEPAVVRMPAQTAVVQEETFAPILYVMTYENLDEAIEVHNAVPQGLSSAIFTQDQPKPSCSSRPAAQTAASPMSTSAPPAPKSAVPSAAKRKPAAAANRARTRGRRTCGRPPTRSTTPGSSRSPRASRSSSQAGTRQLQSRHAAFFFFFIASLKGKW